MCQALIDRIRNGTANIVSASSFNPASPIGSVGTSAVILAQSTECLPRYRAKRWNWVTGPAASQSAYRSELTDIIAPLTVLDILVHHHTITEGAVTITLDGRTTMKESSGDWPFSIDQKCCYYLQIIRMWIKLSPLTVTFQHVKRHHTKEKAYNHLDWFGQRNKYIDGMVNGLSFYVYRRTNIQQKTSHSVNPSSRKWTLTGDGTKFISIYIDSLYTNLFGSRTLAY